MKRKFTVRTKAIIASILLPVILFMLVSPIGKYAVQVVTAPTSVKNIEVITKTDEIELSFDAKEEFDFSNYNIQLVLGNEIVREIDTQENALLISNIDSGVEYVLKIKAVDDFGWSSNEISSTVSTDLTISTQILNEFDRAEQLDFYVIANSLVIFLLSFMLSLWILRFSQTVRTIGTIVLFPSVTIVPLLLFITSVSFSINQVQNQLMFSILASVGIGVFQYFLFLTMNILHTAQFKNIPLEQAAKASQFIFILISTYIMLIYAFGADLGFYIRLALIAPLIFYFSYISMWALKEISVSQIVLRSIVMVIIMILAVVIFSIWPINYVYAMLASAVIFYIMLSISLEIRSFLGSSVWLEYSSLIILITLLLLFTSSWGINGSLI